MVNVLSNNKGFKIYMYILPCIVCTFALSTKTATFIYPTDLIVVYMTY